MLPDSAKDDYIQLCVASGRCQPAPDGTILSFARPKPIYLKLSPMEDGYFHVGFCLGDGRTVYVKWHRVIAIASIGTDENWSGTALNDQGPAVVPIEKQVLIAVAVKVEREHAISVILQVEAGDARSRIPFLVNGRERSVSVGLRHHGSPSARPVEKRSSLPSPL